MNRRAPSSASTPSLATLLRAPGTSPASTHDAAAARPARATPPVASAEAKASVIPPLAATPSTTEASAEPAPSFTRTRVKLPVPGWQWGLIITLALLLAGQILLADRARHAADPRLRPLLETACAALHCTLPAWQEPEAFTMVERAITPLPGHPGVLEVRARFRNDARWTQALPLLELTLSSADGLVSGQRQFTPADYLGQTPPARVAPGQEIQAHWLLTEPELPADAFHFRFR